MASWGSRQLGGRCDGVKASAGEAGQGAAGVDFPLEPRAHSNSGCVRGVVSQGGRRALGGGEGDRRAEETRPWSFRKRRVPAQSVRLPLRVLGPSPSETPTAAAASVGAWAAMAAAVTGAVRLSERLLPPCSCILRRVGQVQEQLSQL